MVKKGTRVPGNWRRSPPDPKQHLHGDRFEVELPDGHKLHLVVDEHESFHTSGRLRIPSKTRTEFTIEMFTDYPTPDFGIATSKIVVVGEDYDRQAEARNKVMKKAGKIMGMVLNEFGDIVKFPSPPKKESTRFTRR